MLFWTYRAIANGNAKLIAQVFWNVVLFIPLGILLMSILAIKYKWIVSIGISFIFSALIEIIQLVSRRGLFEFDDIIHNMLGALIGIGVYILFTKIKLHFASQIQH